MESTNQLTRMLRAAGMRITPQRLAICDYLITSVQHPTAQMIYDHLRPLHPNLSLATVYNTLEALSQLGAIHALGSAGDEAVHYDADTSPHVNLACTSCHQVIDLPSQYVQALGEEVASNSGYKIVGARVLYYGLCPACQANPNN